MPIIPVPNVYIAGFKLDPKVLYTWTRKTRNIPNMGPPEEFFDNCHDDIFVGEMMTWLISWFKTERRPTWPYHISVTTYVENDVWTDCMFMTVRETYQLADIPVEEDAWALGLKKEWFGAEESGWPKSVIYCRAIHGKVAFGKEGPPPEYREEAEEDDDSDAN